MCSFPPSPVDCRQFPPHLVCPFSILLPFSLIDPAAVLSEPHSRVWPSSSTPQAHPDHQITAPLTFMSRTCTGSQSLSQSAPQQRIQFYLQETKSQETVTAEMMIILFSSQECLNSSRRGSWLIQVNIRYKSWSFLYPSHGIILTSWNFLCFGLSRKTKCD